MSRCDEAFYQARQPHTRSMSTHASTSSWLTLDSPSIQHERTLFHLTDDETAMLLDLCHRIPDYNPHLLLKFLFAKKLNVDKAEATFKVRLAPVW